MVVTSQISSRKFVSSWLYTTYRMKPQVLILLLKSIFIQPSFLFNHISQLLNKTLQPRQTSVFKILPSYIILLILPYYREGFYASYLNFILAKKSSLSLHNSKKLFLTVQTHSGFTLLSFLIAFTDTTPIFSRFGQSLESILDSFPFTFSIQSFR